MKAAPNNFSIRVLEAKEPSALAESLRRMDDLGNVEEEVKAIVKEVEEKGDEALINYTERFDGVRLRRDELLVKKEEIKEAYSLLEEEEVEALGFVADRVKAVEEARLSGIGFLFREGGVFIRTLLRPIESVGCYVPGGRASYPTSLIMQAVPAKVAGVKRVVVVTPPSRDGKVKAPILVAGDLCGVREIYKVGGAQSIAALAFGTRTIRRVLKIVGPGNRYVTMAKRLLSFRVGTDFPAGPTELIILADEGANPRLIAKDLISQAEHGEESICGLVTDSPKLAKEVNGTVVRDVTSIPRGSVVRKALREKGFIAVFDDLEDAVTFVNAFAPEHLEVMTRDDEGIVAKIDGAGLILVGETSPSAASDYGAGTNHVLPTAGFAKQYSGLSVYDFVKRISVLECTSQSLEEMLKHIEVLSGMEGLPNHALAVKARLN